MADQSLLTSLCAVCHTSKPKYKCPGCLVKTCSLACVKKHKSWSECPGLRSQTSYVPLCDLRTPAGIDRDYNFLRSIELEMERGRKEAEEAKIISSSELFQSKRGSYRGRNRGSYRGNDVRTGRLQNGNRRRVVPFRPLRETTGRVLEHKLTAKLLSYNIEVDCVVHGMKRQKENSTVLMSKSGLVNWQVEWLLLASDDSEHRFLSKAMDDTQLHLAFAHAYEKQRSLNAPITAKSSKRVAKKEQRGNSGRTQSLQAQNWNTSVWSAAPYSQQDNGSGSWTNDPSKTDGNESGTSAFRFFLVRGRDTNKASKIATPVSGHESLRSALVNARLLEYPTFYVLPPNVKLPERITLGAKQEGQPNVCWGQKRYRGEQPENNGENTPARTGPAPAYNKRRRCEDTVGGTSALPVRLDERCADLEEGEIPAEPPGTNLDGNESSESATVEENTDLSADETDDSESDSELKSESDSESKSESESESGIV